MTSKNTNFWKIWIDTGGTFTDCLSFDPSGHLQRLKVLSNGSFRGQVKEVIGKCTFAIIIHNQLVKGFFNGYHIYFPGHDNAYLITDFDPETSKLTIDGSLESAINPGTDFMITANEEAPVLAARIATQTLLDETLPTISMKLGSTKGTNALLERKGVKTLLLVTKGFKDLLLIGDQHRADLFALKISKHLPLYDHVLEVNERLDKNGDPLIALTDNELDRILQLIESLDISAIAIAFLNSFQNPIHELKIAELLDQNGYNHISCSSKLSNAIKYVPRTTTAVINAYLSPVINNYLLDISKKLGVKSQLKVMTSAGGLVDYSEYLPKDSLLSGPAGGVVGAVTAAKQSGVDKIISFDMGGTSTDVARYDKEYDYQYQTEVGDISMLSPSLSINTVAAGGGSICFFDGFNLKVGPHSAGSNPGPACYGGGGPLTITDINLLLGRLDEGHFTIPLNKQAAIKQLKKIVVQINSTNHQKLTEEEIMSGFLSIANERMAETIKKISIAKGFSAASYSLLAFGGAGSQHACSLAELLGIRTIIIPYNAGILSAYGIGNATLERFATQDFLISFKSIEDGLTNEMDVLEKSARHQLLNEQIDPVNIVIKSKLLYLRFKGQDHSIEIEYNNGVKIVERFEQAYEQLFQHLPKNQEIELESIKIIATEKATEIPYLSIPSPPADNQMTTTRCFANGKWENIPVHRWESISKNKVLKGNCLLSNHNTTIFVHKNWELKVDNNDNVILTFVEKTERKSTSKKKADAIALELFTNRFRGIAEDMGALLKRTSFSVNIKERLDFSCALLDHKGELIVNAPHVPVHLGSMGICVRKVVKVMEMSEGDMIITNHPGFGGSHLPDITLIKPIYYDQLLIGFVANRAHHAEVGGSRPGSMPPNAKNLEEEGVIIPPTYIARKGVVDWTTIQSIFTSGPYPTRSLAENLADLNAGIASLNQGESQLLALCQHYSSTAATYYMQQIKHKSAVIISKALRKFEGKSFNAVEKLDDDWKIMVSISVKNGKATIDFSGTDAQHPGNFNATSAIAYSAILYVFRLLTKENIPLNEGILSVLSIQLPTCFLNPDFPDEYNRCPAVVGGNTETSQRLTDTLIKALELASCSQGTMNNLLFGNDTFGYYETIGGGTGAGNGFDGSSAIHHHMTNTRITDPEILENRYPVRLEEFSIRSNSGGNGKWKGGNGIKRHLTFLAPVSLTIVSQHRKQVPFGLKGGKSGKCGKQYVITSKNELVDLEGVDGYEIEPGDGIVIETPGGGGYGQE